MIEGALSLKFYKTRKDFDIDTVSGEPLLESGGDHCVEMIINDEDERGRWRAALCDKLQSFLCQLKSVIVKSKNETSDTSGDYINPNDEPNIHTTKTDSKHNLQNTKQRNERSNENVAKEEKKKQNMKMKRDKKKMKKNRKKPIREEHITIISI